MSSTKKPSFHRVRRALVFAACALPVLVSSCGARSGIELLGAGAVAGGGAAPIANPPEPALPAGGSVSVGSAGAPGATSGAGGALDFPVKPACESVTVSIDDLRPAVTVVVDQSRSMRSGFPDKGSPNTRWSLVGQALFDPTHGVVKTFESSVRFGIAFFTGHHGYEGAACPQLNEVHAATQNYEALRALYVSLAPDGDTPTGESLLKIVSELEEKPSQGPHSIVLVTDGNPDTCAQPNPDNGQPEAVAAVQAAHAAGYDVYVLGISNDIAGQNLQQLANAGKGKPLDLVWGKDADAAQPFHASSDALGLTAQLAVILNQIPFCEVRLQRDVAVDEASQGHVVLDGQPLPFSPSNGFALKDPRHLEIVGKACEAIRANGKQLSVRISCD
jgi:hypothetical protein